MVLVLRGIDRRHLTLAEGIVEGVVDLAHRQPEPRRGRAIDDQIGLQPLLLLIEIDVGQERHLLQRGFELWRPFVDVVGVVALQRVLVLRVVGAPAGADVLRSLQEEPGTRDLVEFRPQSGHDLLHRDLALGQRFQYDEHETGVGLAAAGERADALDCGIVANDVDEPGELLLHQLEGDALVGLNAAEHQPDILSGKEAFRNYLDQVKTQAQRRQ